MKIYLLRIICLLVATAVMFQACKKDSASSAAKPATQNVGNINFTLKTTDMEGNTESRFSVGQNFIPNLTISNSGSREDTLCRCLLTFSIPNLLGVYSNSSEKLDDSAVLIGSPRYSFNGYFIFHYLAIPADSAYMYAVPWISDTTKQYFTGELFYSSSPETPLPAGQYFIQFVFNYNNTPINLRYNFVVQ